MGRGRLDAVAHAEGEVAAHHRAQRRLVQEVGDIEVVLELEPALSLQ